MFFSSKVSKVGIPFVEIRKKNASTLVGTLRSCMPPTQHVTFRFVDLILLDIWDFMSGNFSSSGGSHRTVRVQIRGKASV